MPTMRPRQRRHRGEGADVFFIESEAFPVRPTARLGFRLGKE